MIPSSMLYNIETLHYWINVGFYWLIKPADMEILNLVKN